MSVTTIESFVATSTAFQPKEPESPQPAADEGTVPESLTRASLPPLSHDDAPWPINSVRLSGRVSGINDPVQLPSGASVISLRVVVPRAGVAGSQRPASTRTQVDTIDVSCWTPASQEVARQLVVGDRVELAGVLRRRFFRAANGPASRYEVEVGTMRRVPLVARLGVATSDVGKSAQKEVGDGDEERW